MYIYIYTYTYIHTLYAGMKGDLVYRMATSYILYIYIYRRATSYIEGLSDAGGLRFESQPGWVTGKTTPRLWRDERPAIKGLRLPGRHAGHLLLVFLSIVNMNIIITIIIIISSSSGNHHMINISIIIIISISIITHLILT